MAVPLFSPVKPCYIQMLSLSKYNECQVLVQGFCKIQEEKLSWCLASILVQRLTKLHEPVGASAICGL